MAECSRRVVTICSTIPKLHHHVQVCYSKSPMKAKGNTQSDGLFQKVCSPALTVVSIDPPASLDPAICDKTDFLITDGCYLGEWRECIRGGNSVKILYNFCIRVSAVSERLRTNKVCSEHMGWS